MSPSLDPKQNVSGISSVTQFIISNNPDCHYIHFELGRKDNESGGLSRVKVIMKSLILWNRIFAWSDFFDLTPYSKIFIVYFTICFFFLFSMYCFKLFGEKTCRREISL